MTEEREEMETLIHAAERLGTTDSHLRRRARTLTREGSPWPEKVNAWTGGFTYVAPASFWDSIPNLRPTGHNQYSPWVTAEFLADQEALKRLEGPTKPQPVAWNRTATEKTYLCPRCRADGKSSKLQHDEDGDLACVLCSRVYPSQPRATEPRTYPARVQTNVASRRVG